MGSGLPNAAAPKSAGKIIKASHDEGASPAPKKQRLRTGHLRHLAKAIS